MSDNTIRSIFIALAAGLVLAITTGCEAPEEVEPPVAEDEESSDDETSEEEGSGDEASGSEARAQLEAPSEPTLREGPEGGQPQNPLQQQGGGGEVTDEQLDRFGDAIESVQALEEEEGDPRERMRQAETRQEQQQVQQELMGQLQQAVEDSGMTFPEFLTLSQRIQQDPELQRRLEERVDIEGLGGPAPGGPPQGAPSPAGEQPEPSSDDE